MAAVGLLRHMLASGILFGTVVVLPTPSGTPLAESPVPIATIEPGSPGEALGDAVADKGSLASGRDSNQDVVFQGPTPAEVKTIIQRNISAVDLQTLVRATERGALSEADSRVRELGAELDLPDQALARMFEMLARQDVPPDRLANVLAEIVARHKALLERVRSLEASEPRAAALRDAVAAALATADYDRVDALLAEAEGIQFEAMRQLLGALDQHVLNAAAIDPEAGHFAGRRLVYRRAIERGALLHGDRGTRSGALLRFVARDRLCRRRPGLRLCQRWADSSSLCERQPNHPVCDKDDDDRSCKKRRDDPLCDDNQSPSPS